MSDINSDFVQSILLVDEIISLSAEKDSSANKNGENAANKKNDEIKVFFKICFLFLNFGQIQLGI